MITQDRSEPATFTSCLHRGHGEGLRPTVRFIAGAADKPDSDNFDTAYHHQGHQIYRPPASLLAKTQPNRTASTYINPHRAS